MFVFIGFIVLLIVDIFALQKGYSVIGYFVLAAFHTISFLIRLFLRNYSKSEEFKIYSGISSTILILLLVVILFENVDVIIDWLGFVLMIGILFSPVLAMWYLTIIHKDYKESIK